MSRGAKLALTKALATNRLIAALGAIAFGLAGPAVVDATGAPTQTPPLVVLRSAAGVQRAAQGSYCVTVPTGTGFVQGCADLVDPEPDWLSVVRPKERFVIRVRRTDLARGVVLVHPRGCENRTVETFKIRRPTTRWHVSLDPGRYELEVRISEFVATDGGFGDTSAALGLLVSESRPLGFVLARDSLACGA
jgi:hypothetical protein